MMAPLIFEKVGTAHPKHSITSQETYITSKTAVRTWNVLKTNS